MDGRQGDATDGCASRDETERDLDFFLKQRIETEIFDDQKFVRGKHEKDN